MTSEIASDASGAALSPTGSDVSEAPVQAKVTIPRPREQGPVIVPTRVAARHLDHRRYRPAHLKIATGLVRPTGRGSDRSPACSATYEPLAGSASQKAPRTASAPHAFGSITWQYQSDRSAGRASGCPGLPAARP